MKKYSSKQKESIIIVEKKMKTTSQIGNILQFFSPFLATKFCARIFASPFKFKTPEREMMYRKSAKNELISIPSIKKEVMIYTYGYSTKKILIAHGWSGRGTQLYELADKLLENKMMVISFDGPAHGLSTGKTTNMLEFLDTIKEIDKKYGPFEAAIGHSFGAMSLLNAISRNKLNLRKLVVISADDSIFEALKKFISKLGLKSKIALKLKTEYEKKLNDKIENYASSGAAKKIIIPTLVIHDTQDKYVAVSSGIEIRHSLELGELLITNGLGHHKIFKDNIVIERIINFLK